MFRGDEDAFDYLSRFENFAAVYSCSEPEKLRCFCYAMQGNPGVWCDLHKSVRRWNELRGEFVRTFGKSAIDYELHHLKYGVAIRDPVELLIPLHSSLQDSVWVASVRNQELPVSGQWNRGTVAGEAEQPMFG